MLTYIKKKELPLYQLREGSLNGMFNKEIRKK